MHIISEACNVKIGRDPGIREQQHSQAARNREFCTARIWLYARRSRRDAGNGVRLGTGETVTVVLRPYQGPLKAPRAEVKDFATLEGEISKVIQSVSSDEMRKQV